MLLRQNDECCQMESDSFFKVSCFSMNITGFLSFCFLPTRQGASYRLAKIRRPALAGQSPKGLRHLALFYDVSNLVG